MSRRTSKKPAKKTAHARGRRGVAPRQHRGGGSADGINVNVNLGRFVGGLTNRWADQAWNQLKTAQEHKLKVDMALAGMDQGKSIREFEAKMAQQKADYLKQQAEARAALEKQQADQRAQVLAQRNALEAERAKQEAAAREAAAQMQEKMERERLKSEAQMAETQVAAAKQMVEFASKAAVGGFPMPGPAPSGSHRRSSPRRSSPRATAAH